MMNSPPSSPLFKEKRGKPSEEKRSELEAKQSFEELGIRDEK
jgi:hypothetical protein